VRHASFSAQRDKLQIAAALAKINHRLQNGHWALAMKPAARQFGSTWESRHKKANGMRDDGAA
jgi:hypothetical protein